MWKALKTICYSIETYRQLSNVTKFVSYTFKAVKYKKKILKKLLFLQSRKVQNRNTIVLILNQNEEKMIQFKFLNSTHVS